jgi:hypothetical protein
LADEFRSARTFRAAQGIPLQAEQVIGCPFCVRFWANKNEQILIRYLCCKLLLLFAQKKKQEKVTRLPDPSGYPALLVIGRTLKNSLCSKSFNVLFRQ